MRGSNPASGAKFNNMLKDNRTNYLTGNISQPTDLDDMFREICGHFGWQIGKARAFTKSHKTIVNLAVLSRLCQRFKLKMEFDVFKDEVTIYYQDKGVAPCEFSEGEPEVIYVNEDQEVVVGNVVQEEAPEEEAQPDENERPAIDFTAIEDQEEEEGEGKSIPNPF